MIKATIKKTVEAVYLEVDTTLYLRLQYNIWYRVSGSRMHPQFNTKMIELEELYQNEIKGE